MDLDRRDWWYPEYTADDNILYTVKGVSTAECPVSLITPDALDSIHIWCRSSLLHESSGTSLFGPDLSEWPARIVEIFEVLESEKLKTENARTTAEIEASRRRDRSKQH